VAVSRRAWEDPRFQTFNELPEDRYEAFLSVPVLSRGKLVGVINVQHRESHSTAEDEIQLISTLGFIVGAEIEMARLEGENVELTEQLETRKVVDRAKGHPPARSRPQRRGRAPGHPTAEPSAPQVEKGDRRGHRAGRRAPPRQRLTLPPALGARGRQLAAGPRHDRESPGRDSI
jgi:hypothetical protein